ncbi:hypothetical protein [Pararhizobium sp. A13]|uniref:hypothetical protein n=1 Tax=Pararhizobium sp. A13 TaxID=3133975 RepID=UPI00324A426D
MPHGVAIHRVISAGVAVAVPAIAFMANGEINMEFIVLGALIGFACWYWGPAWPPL